MTNCEVQLDPIQDYDDPTCGEILISGPCNCSGYLNDEMTTKKLVHRREKQIGFTLVMLASETMKGI